MCGRFSSVSHLSSGLLVTMVDELPVKSATVRKSDSVIVADVRASSVKVASSSLDTLQRFF